MPVKRKIAITEVISCLNLVTKSERRQLDTTEKICPKEDLVILHPIAMTIPNSHGVYTPSKLEPKKEMSYEEFLSRYADHPRKIRVCFDESPTWNTLLQRSELVTAYGFGLDCWYILG